MSRRMSRRSRRRKISKKNTRGRAVFVPILRYDLRMKEIPSTETAYTAAVKCTEEHALLLKTTRSSSVQGWRPQLEGCSERWHIRGPFLHAGTCGRKLLGIRDRSAARCASIQAIAGAPLNVTIFFLSTEPRECRWIPCSSSTERSNAGVATTTF